MARTDRTRYPAKRTTRVPYNRWNEEKDQDPPLVFIPRRRAAPFSCPRNRGPPADSLIPFCAARCLLSAIRVQDTRTLYQIIVRFCIRGISLIHSLMRNPIIGRFPCANATAFDSPLVSQRKPCYPYRRRGESSGAEANGRFLHGAF